jgi:signal transduction histidine kinase
MKELDQLADESAAALGRIYDIAYLEITEDTKRASSIIWRLTVAGLLAVILSVAGAGGLALFFSAWLSRPFQALAQASRQIAEGNLSQRVEVHTGGELGEATRAFNQMADALEQAEKDKADFTAMLVHDLRSPLMAVLSGAAILEDGLEGPVNEAQKKWLARIEAGVRKVVDLVNDFLDLSKIEAGRIGLDKKEIDLGQLVQESIESYRALAKSKQITLKSRIDPTFPQVKADPRYLDQVFSNLLSNAIKFTPEGGVIELGATQDNSVEARAWVKDTGVGIPTHEMENLFEKYRQTASGKNSSLKGTGLGLVISKKIVEAHGGRIWVESAERQGATFFFTLPIT